MAIKLTYMTKTTNRNQDRENEDDQMEVIEDDDFESSSSESSSSDSEESDYGADDNEGPIFLSQTFTKKELYDINTTVENGTYDEQKFDEVLDSKRQEIDSEKEKFLEKVTSSGQYDEDELKQKISEYEQHTVCLKAQFDSLGNSMHEHFDGGETIKYREFKELVAANSFSVPSVLEKRDSSLFTLILEDEDFCALFGFIIIVPLILLILVIVIYNYLKKDSYK